MASCQISSRLVHVSLRPPSFHHASHLVQPLKFLLKLVWSTWVLISSRLSCIKFLLYFSKPKGDHGYATITVCKQNEQSLCQKQYDPSSSVKLKQMSKEEAGGGGKHSSQQYYFFLIPEFWNTFFPPFLPFFYCLFPFFSCFSLTVFQPFFLFHFV